MAKAKFPQQIFVTRRADCGDQPYLDAEAKLADLHPEHGERVAVYRLVYTTGAKKTVGLER